jgi:predicted alpha/beta hydrolase family esterase
MKHHDFGQDSTIQRDESVTAKVTCLIVPGLDGSGPGHWQTLWENSRDDCRRVDLGSWNDPHLDTWCDALGRAVGAAVGPVVLAAHSLGCFAIAWWAASANPSLIAKVRGALLVAPPDVDRPDADFRLRRFAPTPMVAPPFRSILVASGNDPHASLARSHAIANAWNAEFVDFGETGHINARSRLGFWPAGQALLEELIYRSGAGFGRR